MQNPDPPIHTEDTDDSLFFSCVTICITHTYCWNQLNIILISLIGSDYCFHLESIIDIYLTMDAHLYTHTYSTLSK